MKEITVDQREKAIKGGASWFFWIGATTLINAITFYLQSDANFIIGLTTGQLINEFMYGMQAKTSFIAVLINILLAVMFAAFGFFGRKKNRPALIIGISLYTLDAILALVFKDYWSLAVHIFAIIMISFAIKNIKVLAEIESIGTELEFEESNPEVEN